MGKLGSISTADLQQERQAESKLCKYEAQPQLSGTIPPRLSIRAGRSAEKIVYM